MGEVSELTRELVDTVLQKDPAATARIRSAVRHVLDTGLLPQETCTERQAAKILEVSAMFLCKWRNGKRTTDAPPFPFTVFWTDAGHVRYIRSEVECHRAKRMRSGSVIRVDIEEVPDDENDC